MTRKFIYILLLSVLSLLSCDNTEFIPSQKPQPDIEENTDSQIWMSAMIYPQEYDWQADTGSYEATLVLLAGNEQHLEIPSCNSWSSHFIVSGAVYDDRRMDGRTYIQKNGENFLEWDGEELVWDIAIKAKDIYCLCTDAECTKTILRKNAELLSQYNSCWPNSDFYEEEGKLCFDIGGEQTGVIKDAEEYLTPASKLSKYTNVNIHSCSGELWIMGEYHHPLYDISFAGPYYENCTLQGQVWGSAYTGLLQQGYDVLIEGNDNGYYVLYDRSYNELWRTEQKFERIVSGADKTGVYALGRLEDNTYALCNDGNIIMLPDSCTLTPSPCMALRNGKLIVPLVSEQGMLAFWENGVLKESTLNGYITNIVIGNGSSARIQLSY